MRRFVSFGHTVFSIALSLTVGRVLTLGSTLAHDGSLKIEADASLRLDEDIMRRWHPQPRSVGAVA